MSFRWPYYTLHDGWLVDQYGKRCPQQVAAFPADFKSVEAEAWLVEHDIRGNVRD